MRSSLICSTVLSCLALIGFGASQAALAADVAAPVYKARPAAVAPAYNWTGFYFGVNGGGAWGHTAWLYEGRQIVDPSHNSHGGLVGSTIGFNYQFSSNWIAGIEADWDWADIKGSHPCPNPDFNCESMLSSLGTLRGRIGTTWNRWFVYGTGGLAWVHAKIDTLLLNAGEEFATRSWEKGWTVGAGVEWAFADNWSAKLEYLHYEIGTHAYAVDGGILVDAKFQGELIRAGLNYKFNWGAPVISKY
jgi:outer membrane immunogenic protein